MDQSNNLNHFVDHQSQGVCNSFQIAGLDDRYGCGLLPTASRKRPRRQGDCGTLALDEEDGREQIRGNSAEQISPEVERKAIMFFRSWFESFSDKTIPSFIDIEALATLTRLPSNEVGKLLVPALRMEAIGDIAENLSVECKATEFFRGWLTSSSIDTLPKPDDIGALAILTHLPTLEVERLLARMLRGQAVSPSETSIHSAQSGDGETHSLQPLDQDGIYPLLNPRPQIFDDAVNWAKRRGPQCKPTNNVLRLRRNLSKTYQCTRGCGAAFKRKDDWRRHEEDLNYPQDGWICNLHSTCMVKSVLTCSYCDVKSPAMNHAAKVHGRRASCRKKRVKGRIFFRRDKFLDHCDKLHPSIDALELAYESRVRINCQFPQHCGFCDELQVGSWLGRCDHITAHFDAGKDMTTWAHPPIPSLVESNDDDGDDDNDGDDQDSDDHDGKVSEDELGDNGYRPHEDTSTHPSGDSGYGSRGSGQSSINNTGSSVGNNQNNALVAGVYWSALVVPKESKGQHSRPEAATGKVNVPSYRPHAARSTNFQPLKHPQILVSSSANGSTGGDHDEHVAMSGGQDLVHRPKLSRLTGKMNSFKNMVGTKLNFFGGNRVPSNEGKVCTMLQTGRCAILISCRLVRSPRQTW